MNKNQRGQSTIEFLFSFVFAVSLILMVFNTAINYAAGYVTHYATYMASRVYLTFDMNHAIWGAGNNAAAVGAAQGTFNVYKLGFFGIDNSSFQIQDFGPGVNAGQFLMIGGYTKFERSMDLIGRITGQTKLELISESFLGREITRGVCASRTCYAITGEDECKFSEMDITLFDDGC